MSSVDNWDDSQPIYRQLRDRIVSLVIEGVFKEGEAVPSVRQVASEYRINHLTVSKAYQELVEDELLEKRRGLGMFVAQGAQQRLLDRERKQFLETELPAFIERMERLEIDPGTVIELINKEKRNN
ncbi:GntR family transcriptional regulator [Gilvimarinus sp. F26214L]|uniref:GntR family transcriptional regulator n=1 Tax=Gilvimarinus sp. DZF01 TaxID=3461371 RepID=UPI0040459126